MEGKGIFLLDHGGIVTRNIASGNGDDGISTRRNCVITDNSATYNGGYGINSGGHATVIGNIASGNGTDGIIGSVSVYTHNTTTSNTRYGIHSNIGTMIGNIATGNGSFGLHLTTVGGYEGNLMAGNNGGNANPQVSGGLELGPNVCGTNTTCP